MPMVTINEIRRRNLASLKEKYGSWRSLADAFGVSESQLSQWVNASADSRTGRPRGMRDSTCRKLEQAIGLKQGWLDLSHAISANGDSVIVAASAQPPEGYVRLDHLSAQPSMGWGGIVDAQPHIVQSLDVLESWVRQKIGTTDPKRIKVLTGVGASMSPTIQDQDLVFVDITHNYINAPGIYVIDISGLLIIKKALILSDGTLIIRSDNTADYPDEERHNLRSAGDSITICGKVLAWWTLRK